MKAKGNWLDITLNILCLLVLTGTAVYIAATWRSLPEQLPMHYDSSGAVDRYGTKGDLLAISIVPWGVYILFTAIQFIPKSLQNTAFARNDEEREQVYALSGHLINCCKLMIILIFAYCAVTTAAAGGFSGWTVFALIAASLAVLFYWIRRIIKVGSN